MRILIPHRGLTAGKTRLAGVLTSEERASLSLALLRHVLSAALEVTPDVMIVSPERELRKFACSSGAAFLHQSGVGLNAGLEQARAVAAQRNKHLLVVLHADLPLLQADDIRELTDAVPPMDGCGVALAPDRHLRGTNALAIGHRCELRCAFGGESFAAYVRQAHQLGIDVVPVRRPGLAVDIDDADDLAELVVATRWRPWAEAARRGRLGRVSSAS